MSQRAYTVEQLVNKIKNRLDTDFGLKNILVSGEISNLTPYKNGMFYFDLKDANSVISCVVFSNVTQRLTTIPNDGMQVLCRASVSLHTKRGQLQLQIYDIIDNGLGMLNQKFEQLKQKLNNEGYFDQAHKKPIPKYPFSIGLIAGDATDAKQDVITTLKRRWPIAQIHFYPSLVQGSKALEDVIRALSIADMNNHDVLLLVRGGGSIEDLWTFNEEKLVKFIFNLNTPLITGIGHETDFTLCDFVADLRANTPTGAAELCSPNINDINNNLFVYKNKLIDNFNRIFDQYRKKVDNAVKYQLPHFHNVVIENQRYSLNNNINSLQRFPDSITARKLKTRYISGKIITFGSSFIHDGKYKLSNNYGRMNTGLDNLLKGNKKDLAAKLNLLNAYSVQSVLDRGYAIVTSNSKLIKNCEDINISENIDIKLSKGKLTAKVISKEN